MSVNNMQGAKYVELYEVAPVFMGINGGLMFGKLNRWISNEHDRMSSGRSELGGSFKMIDDVLWFRIGYGDLASRHFPTMSRNQIKRAIDACVSCGALLKAQLDTPYSDGKKNQTYWYAINHEWINSELLPAHKAFESMKATGSSNAELERYIKDIKGGVPHTTHTRGCTPHDTGVYPTGYSKCTPEQY